MCRALDGFDRAGLTAGDVCRVTRHVENGGDHLLDMAVTDVGLGGHGDVAIDAVASVFNFVEQVAAVFWCVLVAQCYFHVAWTHGF